MYIPKKIKQENRSLLVKPISQNKKQFHQTFEINDNRKQLLLNKDFINNNTLQMWATWGINESARRHYKDKWGKAYQITNDYQLKEAIENEDNWYKGNQRVELGVFNPYKVKNGAQSCYICYNNSYKRNKDGHTYTWHCGPAL